MGAALVDTFLKANRLYDSLTGLFGHFYNPMVFSSNNGIYIKLGDVIIPINEKGYYDLCLDGSSPLSNFFENTPSIKARNVEELVTALGCLGEDFQLTRNFQKLFGNP